MNSTTNRGLLAGLLSVALWAPAAMAEGVEALRQEARQVPKEAPRALELALRLRRAGLYVDGIRVARTALSTARGAPVVTDLLLEIARQRLAEGDPAGAMRECGRLHRLDETKRQICVAETELLRRRGSLALPAAEAALSRDAGSYDAQVAKGRALAQLGSAAEAEAVLRKAMAGHPRRVEAHRALAELLIDEGQRDAGLALLREARRAAPEDPDVLTLLGERSTNVPEAVEALRAAIAERPSEARAHARLGRLLLESGDAASAEQALGRAIVLDARQADWHADLARVHLARGKGDEALASAKAALNLVANHAGAKLAEANALAARGEIDPAIAAFESATALARRDPTPFVDAARACLEHGRPTTARAFAERATLEFSDFGPGWEVLGDAARAGGDTAEARAAYKSALGTRGVDRAAVQEKISALK